MKPFIESQACDKIFNFLKERSRERAVIGPTSHNTFKAFEIPMDQIKVVLLGGSPYNGFIGGKPIASGILLDCSIIEQPSYELQNFYRGLEIELFNGLNLEYDQGYYSTKYLQDQGVMMLNSTLTVEEGATHNKLWEPFMNHVMDIFVELDIPVVFMGKQAEKYTDVMGDSFLTFTLDAPSGTIKEWDTKGVFQKVDELIEESNKDSIMWLNIDVPF